MHPPAEFFLYKTMLFCDIIYSEPFLLDIIYMYYIEHKWVPILVFDQNYQF